MFRVKIHFLPQIESLIAQNWPEFQTNWSLTFGVAPIASGTKYILVFDFISQLLDIEISLNTRNTLKGMLRVLTKFKENRSGQF